jgi:hypothetical protein
LGPVECKDNFAGAAELAATSFDCTHKHSVILLQLIRMSVITVLIYGR